MNTIKRCEFTMKDVFEGVLNHLSNKDSTNLGNEARNLIMTEYFCPPMPKSQIDERKVTSDDLYISILMYILAEDVPTNLKDVHTEPFNWETNFIASWMERYIKSKKYSWLKWQNFAYEALINDFFTMKGQDVSLLDIAHLFSIYDYAVLPLEVSIQ